MEEWVRIRAKVYKAQGIKRYGSGCMPKAGTYDYPFYDLDHVIEKLRRFYEVTRTDETERSVVAEALGMAERGGGFANLISSMEKYGFIRTGGGNVTVTDLGKIVLYGDSTEIEQAKTTAVTNIDLFREVNQQYGTNVTVEQMKAFLRQKALVDIAEAQKIAPKVVAIYKKVSNYITTAEKPSVVPTPSVEGIGRGEIMPPEVTKIQPLKIQYGNVYIQIPPNDPKAIKLAIDALEFMSERIRKESKEEE